MELSVDSLVENEASIYDRDATAALFFNSARLRPIPRGRHRRKSTACLINLLHDAQISIRRSSSA